MKIVILCDPVTLSVDQLNASLVKDKYRQIDRFVALSGKPVGTPFTVVWSADQGNIKCPQLNVECHHCNIYIAAHCG